MILLLLLIILLIVGAALIEGNKLSGYNVFCNLECWRRRKPCCIRS